jgi:hypothetical protein
MEIKEHKEKNIVVGETYTNIYKNLYLIFFGWGEKKMRKRK